MFVDVPHRRTSS
jgi:serine/threonine protein kinase